MDDSFVQVADSATITRESNATLVPAHVEGSSSATSPTLIATSTNPYGSKLSIPTGLSFLDGHPFVKNMFSDKVYGCIIGSALGDTIGLYTEFLPKVVCQATYPGGRFSLTSPVTEPYSDQHRDKFERCAWTDDTDNALLIILAYLHDRSIDTLPDSFAQRLRIWIQHGLLALDKLPIGIGNLVRCAVTSPNYLKDPEAAAIRQWVASGYNNAPNGSLMRTHPIGIIAVDMCENEAFQLAAAVGRTTHADPRCTVSCCVVVGAVRGILRGEIVDEQTLNRTIERAYSWVSLRPDLVDPFPASDSDGEKTGPAKELDRKEFERHVYAASKEDLQLAETRAIGYVYKCLGSALLFLRRGMRVSNFSNPPPKLLFETLISNLVMEGGDADTNAAVAGALLGAWLGYSRLPAHWADGLKHREWLAHKTHRLLIALGIENGDLNPEDDEKPEGPRGLLSTYELGTRELNLLKKIMEGDAARREAKKKKSQGKGATVGNWFRTTSLS